MNNIILDIKRGINVESLLQNCILDIFQNGTTDRTCLEMLSLIKLYQPDIFSKYEESILMKMGLFYKPIKPKTFEDAIFQIYREEINDTEDTGFTPVQAQIIKKINDNNIFSFSSPTSTGKSYVFRYLIKEIKTDSVIIVPSRALINEYFRILNEVFKENKEVNVLTFVDIINTKKAKRNVFIITPERTNELFKLKEQLNVGLILLDEAQLSDDKSVRGLYYDSVIRRITKQFKNAKLVFAYPFIANPEMQFIRNDITIDCKESVSYSQKNVGQIFFSFDNQGNFYHFGISKNTFGNKIKTNFDPLLQVIHRDGTALIYCSKAKIYNKQIFHDFRDYVFACPKRTEVEAKILIEKFRTLIGASDKETGDYRSTMVNFLKRGIVVHHGSLPLSARTILEEFTRKGFCRLCFATSTLDQGINMPFDLVWIDRFQPSKPLSVKNLIGRAGRSTSKPKFDFGQIVIKDASKQQLRKIVENDILLDAISQLDITTDSNDDYKEYKEAIKNDQFSEEFNLTYSELDRVQNETSEFYVRKIISDLFDDQGRLIDISYDLEDEVYVRILGYFCKIYENYLKRPLCIAENYVLTTAIKIMLWRIKGKKFSQIVMFRYSYAAKTRERHKKIAEAKSDTDRKFAISYCNLLPANQITEFAMIPNKNLNPISLTYKQRAIDVDYDRVMVDTYDYMDKLLGFRLGDVFYAAFFKYGVKQSSNSSLKLAQYIKYGTIDEKSIWLLRYGFEFEDFDWIYDMVISIDSTEIKFNDNITTLTDEQFDKIRKFI